MRVEFHDAEVGNTLAGAVNVDYEYQAEQWVIDAATDAQVTAMGIVRIECPAIRRTWTRENATHGVAFNEVR